MGDSSKHGRKTDAETKGRKIDFEDAYGVNADADVVFDDIVGTTQPITTDAELVPTARQDIHTASENVPTDTQAVTTAEEEVARKRAIKGKAVVTDTEQEQSRKISKKDQAQIDFDARMAEQLASAEIEKKRKQEEDEVASFMEAKRLNKLEAVVAEPLSIVPPTILHEKPPMFSYVPTE